MTTLNNIEQRIVSLLRNNDKQGIALLYDHYAPALYGVIQRVVPDQDVAEEILQDVMVKIWQRFEQYDAGKGRLFTWMLNVARNTAIDYARVKKHQRQNQSLDNVVNVIDAQQSLSLNIDTIGLQKMTAALSDEHRSIVDLIYFNGYTQVETADALQIPLGTVKTRLRAALIQLKKMF